MEVRLTITKVLCTDTTDSGNLAAAILTQHWPTSGWFPVFRPYTPVHDLDERGTLQLMVKQYPKGAASTYMHSLEPGQTLKVRGPLPGYTWKPSQTPRDVLLVAGGAGITPIYSLTKGVLSNPADRTRIQLLWGVNSFRDIVLKDELEALEKQRPDRLHVTYAVSGAEGVPDAPRMGAENKYRKGYIDKTVLHEAIQRCEKGSWGDEKGTKVFLCGPPSMEDTIAGKQGALRKLGVDIKTIYRF
ncbi:MAG: cytochrome b5 reductase family protein [Janthinobacterium lividum]